MVLEIYLVDGATGIEYKLPEKREVIVGKGPFKKVSEQVTKSGKGCVAVRCPESPDTVEEWKTLKRCHCLLTRHDLQSQVESSAKLLSVRGVEGEAEFREGGTAHTSNYGGNEDILKLGEYELQVRVGE